MVDIEQMKVIASIPVGKSPHGVLMLKSGAAGTVLAPVRAVSTVSDQK